MSKQLGQHQERNKDIVNKTQEKSGLVLKCSDIIILLAAQSFVDSDAGKSTKPATTFWFPTKANSDTTNCKFIGSSKAEETQHSGGRASRH